MILAVDSYGQQYFSVSQGNTNTQTFELFLRGLVKLLSEEDRRWRSNTLITLDGAAYHQSAEMRKLFAELQVPVAVSGAHSYDYSPCEVYYALFKRADINPRKVKCGKR